MISSKLRPAVFLDRDGTINVEKNYLIDPAEFEFIPSVPQALKRLQDAGFLLVVVTNQAGIARGYFSLEQVHRLHEYMMASLEKYDVNIDAFYICPHHPKEGVGELKRKCNCRKGRPGMLLQAAEELGIDLQQSYMVGDKEADVQAGYAAGCRSYLVKTGYGESCQHSVAQYGAEVAVDLPDAVKKILAARDW